MTSSNTNTNNNNSNIFVQQTFNGERMVSTSAANRRVLSPNTTNEPTATTPPATTTSNSTAPTLNTPPMNNANKTNSDNNESNTNQTSEYRFVSATIKAASTSKSTNKEPIASRLANHLQQQHTSHSATQINTNRNDSPTHHTTSPVQQPRPSTPSHTPVPQPYARIPFDSINYKRYWSEANIAVFIQLHRKHYHGIANEDPIISKSAWHNLTQEFNNITNDDRSLTELTRKLDKLLAKYNAERNYLMLQRRASSGLQQPMPLVSYWNHFQYMDNYLSHLPVPDHSLYKRKGKREQSETQISQLLDTQRLFMEQTAIKHQQQINMMNDNYEAMNKMNTKFVELCERVTSGTRANEDRYLKLLEKLIHKQDQPDTRPITKKARVQGSNVPVVIPAEDEEEDDKETTQENDSCILF